MEEIGISEAEATAEVLEALIRLSEAWEAENSCYGYRKNEAADIINNRIFLARDGREIVGYLFGHRETSERAASIMPDGTVFFEVEELYVKPERRNSGVGSRLFEYAENALRGEAEFLMLSTAAKNWRAILRFYVDELGMEFWSARLFKRLAGDGGKGRENP